MAKTKLTLFVDKDLISRLNILSKYTRVSKSEYIREGIKMILEKYKKEVAIMDAGKVPFNEIVPTINRLREEGRYEEAELFEKSVLEEIEATEKLMAIARKEVKKINKRSRK